MTAAVQRSNATSASAPREALLQDFQKKLLTFLGAQTEAQARALDAALAEKTPTQATDLLNPATALLTIAGHYDNVLVAHQEERAKLERRLLGLKTAQQLMARHGFDLEGLAKVPKEQLLRWVSAEAAEAVQSILRDPEVARAGEGDFDVSHYPCFGGTAPPNTAHLDTPTELLGKATKAKVDVVREGLEDLSKRDGLDEVVVGQGGVLLWDGAVAVQNGGAAALDYVGQLYADQPGLHGVFGQALALGGKLTYDVFTAPVRVIDPAVDDATRGAAVIDSIALGMGPAVDGAQLLGRSALEVHGPRLIGRLKGAARALGELGARAEATAASALSTDAASGVPVDGQRFIATRPLVPKVEPGPVTGRQVEVPTDVMRLRPEVKVVTPGPETTAIGDLAGPKSGYAEATRPDGIPEAITDVSGQGALAEARARMPTLTWTEGRAAKPTPPATPEPGGSGLAKATAEPLTSSPSGTDLPGPRSSPPAVESSSAFDGPASPSRVKVGEPETHWVDVNDDPKFMVGEEGSVDRMQSTLPWWNNQQEAEAELLASLKRSLSRIGRTIEARGGDPLRRRGVFGPKDKA